MGIDSFFISAYLYAFYFLEIGLSTLRIRLAVTFFIEFVILLVLYIITPYSSKLIDPKYGYRYMLRMKFSDYLKFVKYLEQVENKPKGKWDLKDLFGALALIHLGLSFLVEIAI
ncbi:MAG: hypothetical protein ACP6IS_06490 [Candidatus Asgardarchaeia archaeon]